MSSLQFTLGSLLIIWFIWYNCEATLPADIRPARSKYNWFPAKNGRPAGKAKPRHYQHFLWHPVKSISNVAQLRESERGNCLSAWWLTSLCKFCSMRGRRSPGGGAYSLAPLKKRQKLEQLSTPNLSISLQVFQPQISNEHLPVSSRHFYSILYCS